MRKNRAGYAVMLLAEILLFIWSGQPFLACVVIGQIFVTILVAVMLRRDAAKIRLEFSVPVSAQEGRAAAFAVKVHVDGRLWVTQRMIVEIKLKNRMFGTQEQRKISLMISDQTKRYERLFEMRHCGQTEFEVEKIWVQDIFRLFRAETKTVQKCSCICYPRRLRMQVSTSEKTIGTPKTEGVMQNKKGHDPSEMYDIRDYVPGDDVRSIHWKLSSKSEELVLREPSDPSHYRVAVMADYGMENWDVEDREAREREWNMVIAAGSAICRELAAKGERFCMIFPAADGLKICEIGSRKEYVQVLTEWMCMPMQKPQGTGFRYFMNQQLDREFSRLVILEAGRTEQNLAGADRRIGITMVCAVDGLDEMQTEQVSNTFEIIEIPAEETAGVYRIMC